MEMGRAWDEFIEKITDEGETNSERETVEMPKEKPTLKNDRHKVRGGGRMTVILSFVMRTASERAAKNENGVTHHKIPADTISTPRNEVIPSAQAK